MAVSLTQKVLFAKHLAVMLRSGLPITEALEIAEESSQGHLKIAVMGVAKSVRTGRTLSEALGDYPKIFSAPLFQLSTIPSGLTIKIA